MSTFEQLVQRTLLQAEDWLGDEAVYGTLHAGIDADDASFTVDGAVYPDGSGVATGLAEIDDELLHIQSANRTTGVVSGVMRGWRGTVPATHATNALVRFNPVFPRLQVKQALNDAIEGVYPRLYRTSTTNVTISTGTVLYALPAGCEQVLSVEWMDTSSFGYGVVPLSYWRHDQAGGQIQLPQTIAPGDTVRVTWAGVPTRLSAAADSFTTVTGLLAEHEEIVVLGATWRLLIGAETQGVLGRNLEQTQLGLAGLQRPRTGSVVSMLQQIYEQRMAEAERRLWARTPAVRHYQ